jgi:hypothetical protein
VKSVEVANAAELNGMPQDYVDMHKSGANGKIELHLMARVLCHDR